MTQMLGAKGITLVPCQLYAKQYAASLLCLRKACCLQSLSCVIFLWKNLQKFYKIVHCDSMKRYLPSSSGDSTSKDYYSCIQRTRLTQYAMGRNILFKYYYFLHFIKRASLILYQCLKINPVLNVSNPFDWNFDFLRWVKPTVKVEVSLPLSLW